MATLFGKTLGSLARIPLSHFSAAASPSFRRNAVMKAWNEPLTSGVQQAKNYAGKLSIRHAFAANGQGVDAAKELGENIVDRVTS